MANKRLFPSANARALPRSTTLNEAGGTAYRLGPKHALAQLAATGCLNSTFYTDAETQLEAVLKLAPQVPAAFLAKTAVYARERGFMKDMPALLCSILSVSDPSLLRRTFPRVINNMKMLRNFVQIMRSGVTGRRSLGAAPKKLVLEFLESRSEVSLFRQSVGQSPSLADVIKMVHPKPKDERREAFYGYLLGREHAAEQLPRLIRDFEAFKEDSSRPVPDVPFQMLTSLDLGPREWSEIAATAGWQMTRMNLNTFSRHGVFTDPERLQQICERLCNPELIRKAAVFPYQLLVASRAARTAPPQIRTALEAAMEIATSNVPSFDLSGPVYILVDVSGSMQCPVTGWRRGASTTERCVDVAALFAATMLRANPNAEVIPFDTSVVACQLDPEQTVMTNAAKLASVGGGGTSLSAPLKRLNRDRREGDLVVFFSDNESWIDTTRVNTTYNSPTATLREWSAFRERNPRAKLVCIDIAPYAHTQAPDRSDILNVGGFSDQVFDVVGAFASANSDAGHWVDVIEGIEL